jgi:hypothetical protein
MLPFQKDFFLKLQRRMEKLRSNDGVKLNEKGGRPKKFKLHPVNYSPGVIRDVNSTGSVHKNNFFCAY